MGRPTKSISDYHKLLGLKPLRQYWQEINRHDRHLLAWHQAKRKARDRRYNKRRPKCRCEAYPWPHRPCSGFCRHPDPPVACWLKKRRRRYRERYAGIRKQIARSNSLHPIRDRAIIDELMPTVRYLAMQLKSEAPHVKYRNIEIKEAAGGRMTLTGHWQTAGPMM